MTKTKTQQKFASFFGLFGLLFQYLYPIFLFTIPSLAVASPKMEVVYASGALIATVTDLEPKSPLVVDFNYWNGTDIQQIHLTSVSDENGYYQNTVDEGYVGTKSNTYSPQSLVRLVVKAHSLSSSWLWAERYTANPFLLVEEGVTSDINLTVEEEDWLANHPSLEPEPSNTPTPEIKPLPTPVSITESKALFAQGVFSTITVPILTTPECFNDSEGVNDEPGQKDLTKMCRDMSSSDPLIISWNWDIVSLSGNNSADACSLFDTDNDGLANYSLCVTWLLDRQQISGSPNLYQCADTRADRCAGSTEISNPSSSCTVVLSTDDPFVDGDSYPQDAQALCTINMEDVGGVTRANLIDVCSYPSKQPNSDPSDCVAIRKSKANLQVLKDVVPDDFGTNWQVTISGPTNYNDTLIGDDTTGLLSVDPGTYTITETGVAGTDI